MYEFHQQPFCNPETPPLKSRRKPKTDSCCDWTCPPKGEERFDHRMDRLVFILGTARSWRTYLLHYFIPYKSVKIHKHNVWLNKEMYQEKVSFGIFKIIKKQNWKKKVSSTYKFETKQRGITVDYVFSYSEEPEWSARFIKIRIAKSKNKIRW